MHTQEKIHTGPDLGGSGDNLMDVTILHQSLMNYLLFLTMQSSENI